MSGRPVGAHHRRCPDHHRTRSHLARICSVFKLSVVVHLHRPCPDFVDPRSATRLRANPSRDLPADGSRAPPAFRLRAVLPHENTRDFETPSFPRRSGRSSATRGTRQPRTHVPRAKDAEEHRARGSRARHSTESCEAGHSRACELSRPTDETWEREDAIVRRDVPRIEDTATVR